MTYPPKFAMPVSYILVDTETQDFISTCVPIHLADAIARRVTVDGRKVTVVRRHYVDCDKCRARRIEYEKHNHNYFVADKQREQALGTAITSGYWCNDCQGTGWVPESSEASQRRHGYITDAMRLYKMPIPELTEELANGVLSRYDKNQMSKVLLARLEEALTPLSQRT